MYDRQRLSQLFIDLERYFVDLDSLHVERVEDLQDKKTFYAVSMVLFSILNHAIDIGEEILASKKLGVPNTYRDIFHLLSKSGIIDNRMEKEMAALVGYRNLLAHEYSDFSEKDVFRVVQRISAVRVFSDAIKNQFQGVK